MTAKKRAAAVKGKGTDIEPDFDVLALLTKYRRQIIITASTICIIIAFCIFYTFSVGEADGAAWHSLTSFINTTPDPTIVEETQIQSMLSETEGTSAEPWGLFSSASIYFSKKNYDEALTIINKLEKDYADHYIVKDKRLLDNLKTLLTKEMAWQATISSSTED